MKLIFLKEFGDAFIPKKVRPGLKRYLEKAGIADIPYAMYGALFYLSIFLTLVIYLGFIYSRIRYSGIVLFAATIALWTIINLAIAGAMMLVLNAYYSVIIYKRTQRIEKVLPEFLEAVRINLDAGMTFDKALWNAVDTDFDVLAKEIEIVAKKGMTGEDVEDALKEFAAKYDSAILNETVELINVSLQGGANITETLERLVESIKTNNYLKDTVLSSVMGYIIFITIISVIIAPILFALAYNLLVIFEGFGAKMGAVATELLSVKFASVINKANFVLFSRYCIIVIAGFSAAIIGLLRKGNIKGSLKTIPIFIAISLALYEIVFRALSFAFGKLF